MTPLESLRYIARNPYAWPGGYDIYAVMDDGGVLCAECVKENYQEILRMTKYDTGWNTGWELAAIGTSDWIEESMLCDNCYRELCPYGLEEDEK